MKSFEESQTLVAPAFAPSSGSSSHSFAEKIFSVIIKQVWEAKIGMQIT